MQGRSVSEAGLPPAPQLGRGISAPLGAPALPRCPAGLVTFSERVPVDIAFYCADFIEIQ